MRALYFLFFTFLGIQLLQAGGVRGYVRSDGGEPLTYASILVQETGTGAVANAEGYYEIRLDPGAYTLVFQFLGYETRVERISIGENMRDLDVRLREQTLELKEVEIYEGREDPAYTVMRKAIAKADYHRQQIDHYEARVYLKGTGRLLKSPWYLRRELAKEGIDSTVAFTSESVSIIEYQRPTTFKERVISVYQHGEDNDVSPMGYINGSFYHAEIADAISPLSPKAFAYYRFRLDGYFQDRGYGVNKIAVIPRSRGDNVFEGHIYIVEDLWSIHSLDLAAYKLGIRFNIRQMYSPIDDKAWMPVTAKIDIKGKVLGFAFEYFYLANLSNYEIRLNPDLPNDFVIVDEKINPEQAREAEQRSGRADVGQLEQQLSSGEELSRKNLRKLMREYEKEERKEAAADTAQQVVGVYEYHVDSAATKRDSAYWAELRPLPLTELEVRGYERRDSMARVQRLEEEAKTSGDTSLVKRKRSDGRFGPGDLVTGESWKLKEKHYLDYRGLLEGTQFNLVEGFSLATRLGYRYTGKSNQFNIGISPRYGFAWDRFTYKAAAEYNYGPQARRNSLQLEGGRYLFQYNAAQPISPTINALAALLFERNYLRLYESAYGQLTYRRKWEATANFDLTFNWADRRTVRNNSDYTLFDNDERTYEPNIPLNLEVDYPLPARERAFVVQAGFEIRPWQKYRLRNNQRQSIDNTSPTFRLEYRKGVPEIGESVTDYDLIDFTYRHKFDIGVRGKMDLKVNAGMFLNNDHVGFADFKHFPGNQVFLTTLDPVGSFRLLPYYDHSTREEYAAAFAHYHFRKFLLSRIWEVQLMGIRENVFVNYLATPTSRNYFEVGYSIDNIFRIFRLELAASFQDGRYRDFGILVGIASNLGGIIQFD